MKISKKIKEHIPTPKRLHMPDSYHIENIPYVPPKWELISDKLVDADYYWIVTTQPNGDQHVVPVWGIWLNGIFYFVTRRESKKARNLYVSPKMTMHLQSSSYVVIIQGITLEVNDSKLLNQFSKLYSEKYGDDTILFKIKVVFALNPTVAYTWLAREYKATATQWQFKKKL